VNGHLARASVLLALLTLFTPAAAGAQAQDTPAATEVHDAAVAAGQPSRYAFELGGFLMATWFPKPLAVDAGVDSDRTIGFGGSISLAYRGPFFLYPFIDVGFYNLAQTTIHPVTHFGGVSGDSVDNSLSAWTFMIGPGVDVGPMRFRGGVGMNKLQTSMTGKNFDDDASALGFLTSLNVSGSVLRTPGFRLNVEGRFTYFMYAGGTVFALGVSGAGDVISW
jgi:hypothetical protein